MEKKENREIIENEKIIINTKPEKIAENLRGVYVHVPFCISRCPYCDFYSGCDTALIGKYTAAVKQTMEKYSSARAFFADTLYFGGGTPSLIGAENIAEITKTAKRLFSLKNAEITVEANPDACDRGFFEKISEAGVTRVSIGLQSANSEELKRLGRRHTAKAAKTAVENALAAGIKHVSLDLMLATPGQTVQSLTDSVSFCADSGADHISAYILKVEPSTVFGKMGKSLVLPDEEQTRKLYFTACEELEKRGFLQYEISNFAKPDCESRHNLKYWNAQEYLGIGPAAHSLLFGRRFYYPRDIEAFLAGNEPQNDGNGGDFEEYAMLRLRLNEGLREDETKHRFGHNIPVSLRKKAENYQKYGLTDCDEKKISLTREGFMVSNELLAEIL